MGCGERTALHVPSQQPGLALSLGSQQLLGKANPKEAPTPEGLAPCERVGGGERLADPCFAHLYFGLLHLRSWHLRDLVVPPGLGQLQGRLPELLSAGVCRLQQGQISRVSANEGEECSVGFALLGHHQDHSIFVTSIAG